MKIQAARKINYAISQKLKLIAINGLQIWIQGPNGALKTVFLNMVITMEWMNLETQIFFLKDRASKNI